MIVPSDLRLLVVDDNSHARMTAIAGLKALGVTNISEATGGAAAAAMMIGTPFDVVLTDWFMPDVNGAGLIEIVQNSGIAHMMRAHIIVMTAYAAAEHLARARSLGVSDIIVKPINEKHLATALARVLAAGDQPVEHATETAVPDQPEAVEDDRVFL